MKRTNGSWAMPPTSYHRIDIRQTSRHLVVRHGDRIIADTNGRWFSTSPASRRAGTFHATMSMSLRSLPWNARLLPVQGAM